MSLDIKKFNPWNWFKQEEDNEKSREFSSNQQLRRHSGNTLPMAYQYNPLWNIHREIDRLFDDVMHCYDKGVRVFYNISENFCLQDSDREFVRRVADFRDEVGGDFVTTNPNSSFLPIYFNKDKTPNTELIGLLKRAGFDLVTISLETISPRFDDKRLFKRYPMESIEALWHHFKEQGLALHLYMMSGFPGMTLEELRAERRAAAEPNALLRGEELLPAVDA